MPKAELHVHIEGCLEPELVLKLAKRNNLQHKLPYKTLAEAEAAFQYDNLQEFLDLRDATLQVLMTEQDFYEVTMLYFSRIGAQNVVHTEIFFDPQVHTMRNVGFDVFMPGLIRGIQDGGKQYGITTGLLMCFMTELGPQGAEECLQQAMPYIKDIMGVGLARGIPNWKGGRASHTSFAPIFNKCKDMGLHLTAHAGEEGPADELWESINELKVERIDHGVSCLQDPKLMKLLKQTRMPLTVCPCSNFKLQVYRGTLFERMKELIAAELCVTVNTDDPPFFGGYMNENYQFWVDNLGLTEAQILQLGLNSFEAAFMPESEKSRLQQEVHRCSGLQNH
ncbi:hypothetical protein WJX77_005891 [Trebouxia sp. C0004]